MAGGRLWTPEEDRYLEENVGGLRLKTIAKKLDRTTRAVLSRLERLGLANTKLQSGRLTASELARAIGVDNHVPLRWIKEKGLRSVSKVTNQSARFHLIDVDEFWEWAEVNKASLNFSRIGPHVLLPQPDWVDEQRRIDAKEIPKKANASWTPMEHELVISMVRSAQSVEAIAQRLDRTEKAVQRKISKLRQAGRLPFARVVIPWSAEEVSLMVELECQGKTDVEIAYELGREHYHIVDKRRRLKKEDWYLQKVLS